MKKIKTYLIICICFVFLLILFTPYLKVEFLTMKYGKEFYNLQKQTNMLLESEYYKVISYSKDLAKVFYVSDTGDLLTFEKDSSDKWECVEWKTVWSESGSASEFIWPYYR